LSETWYWESSGAEITQFFWAEDQPKYGLMSDEMCIVFRPNERENSWIDIQCFIYPNFTMCE